MAISRVESEEAVFDYYTNLECYLRTNFPQYLKREWACGIHYLIVAHTVWWRFCWDYLCPMVTARFSRFVSTNDGNVFNVKTAILLSNCALLSNIKDEFCRAQADVNLGGLRNLVQCSIAKHLMKYQATPLLSNLRCLPRPCIIRHRIWKCTYSNWQLHMSINRVVPLIFCCCA